MTRSLFALPLLALFVLAGAAFAPASGGPGSPDEQAVQGVIDRLFEVLNAHDADAHAALYADGAQCYWGGGEVVTLDDRAAFTEAGRAFHAQAAALRFETDGAAQIRLLDADTATAFVPAVTHAGDDTSRSHILLVLQKAPSGWLIATEHHAFVP